MKIKSINKLNPLRISPKADKRIVLHSSHITKTFILVTRRFITAKLIKFSDQPFNESYCFKRPRGEKVFHPEVHEYMYWYVCVCVCVCVSGVGVELYGEGERDRERDSEAEQKWKRQLSLCTYS